MYGHYIYYEIFRTEYVDHDQEDNKCDDKDIAQTPTVTECIEEHINVKLGCNVPWHSTRGPSINDVTL